MKNAGSGATRATQPEPGAPLRDRSGRIRRQRGNERCPALAGTTWDDAHSTIDDKPARETPEFFFEF